MTRSLKRKLTRKKPEILEYFRFKGRLTVPAFIEVINDAGIEIEPHEGQWSIIDAYEERVPASDAVLKMAEENGLTLDYEYKSRCLVAACGRRFGKSVVASLLGACEMLIPNARVLIVSYTLDNCEVIFEQVRKTIVELLGPKEIVSDRQKDMELVLRNGAELRVASNDNVQSKLGKSVSLLIIDEAKLFNRKLYEQVLRPMLFDYAPYSRTILISSPEAGWFETYYNWGQDNFKKGYWSINLPTHSNPVIPREELDEMERNMPRDLYEQEVLGMFTSNAGLVCREFDKKTHVYNPDDYPIARYIAEGNVTVHMIDSGYSHYFGSVWAIRVEALDTFFVFAEYQRNKAVTPVIAEDIGRIESEWDVEPHMRYADPAAAQQIADFVTYNLYFQKADKNLRETVNNLNTLFFQTSLVTGKPKLLISSDCPELIRQLSSIIWKAGKEDEQTREKNDNGVKPFCPDREGPSGGGAKTDWDMFDAFRYGMYTFAKSSGAGISIMTFSEAPDEEDEFEAQMYAQGFYRTG